ncbi:MAG: HEAT repeat domain-containing protein [Candidatus Tectomicrobia bacterium]|nr:HEAT repeat domain-containing protein [Candidatus Tectomicrobia bacterium]
MVSASQDDAPDVGQLLQDLRDDRFWVRERAAEALGHRRSQDAIAGLRRALEDTTSTVSKRAAEALARIGSEQAHASLFDTLGEEKATEILTRVGSKKAVRHVQHMRLEQATERWHEALRHDLYAQRWQAAQTLWKSKGYQAIEELLQALQDADLENRDRIREDASLRPLSCRPDEYTLLDALSRQDFQAGWRIARDLAQMDAEYAAYIFERVLDLSP